MASFNAENSGSRLIPKLNMGWIPYWNLVPFKAELQKALGSSVQFTNGHPSAVNKWLVEGTVDTAPCSSVCLLKNPQFDIAAPVGVASDGPVASVYLGFNHEQLEFLEVIKSRNRIVHEIVRQAQSAFPDDPRRVAQMIWQVCKESALDVNRASILPLNLTTSSATSVMLTRLLYRLWFGDPVDDISSHGYVPRSGVKPIDLLIGDEALQRRPEYAQILDLGQVWKDMTSLPFVYAVWQSASPLATPIKRMILDSADLAQARMRIEPSVYVPDMKITRSDGEPIDLGAYWKVIQYRLGPNHMRGLALFFSLARHMIQVPADGDLLVKIMRWQSTSSIQV